MLNLKDFDDKKHKLRLKDVLKGEMVIKSTNGKTYKKHADVIWSEIEEIIIKTLFVI